MICVYDYLFMGSGNIRYHSVVYVVMDKAELLYIKIYLEISCYFFTTGVGLDIQNFTNSSPMAAEPAPTGWELANTSKV